MSIEIKNISKNFGNTCALDGVSLNFEENRIYGLLGRNGAGKTTLLNIITNRIFSDDGEVFVDGIPARENDEALRKIYMMGEKNFYPENMKIKEIFRWSKEFYPDFDLEYANKLADIFDLNLNKNVKSLSTGYNSIFKVIIALSVNTPYVLLDEPVLGLDANHRDVFYKQLIEKYSNSPATFVISTHLIEEVSSVIEDVIIIKKGRIIRNESREELMSVGYTVSGMASLVDKYIKDKEVIGVDVIGGLKSAYIMGHLSKDMVPEGLEITKMDLQKLFVQLTNA
ncbi:MAG: ABC transporter ATP-binding protein [Herbinix sp.]|nr:ABC transporter ATP-binding protein [Herbinix sp.]